MWQQTKKQNHKCTLQLHGYPVLRLLLLCYLHSVVLSGVVSNRLQERLSMVTQGYSLGVEFSLVCSSCAQGVAVVFILLFIIIVVDLAGL